ncbi:MAG: hypothetical protein RMY62_026220 [Nostoc sp. ZfuVER08]|nr:hypothetical protein [Nostoc sp. ZfuVER08]
MYAVIFTQSNRSPIDIAELEQLYRKTKDVVESRQYLIIIWLLAQGKKTEEVERLHWLVVNLADLQLEKSVEQLNLIREM